MNIGIRRCTSAGLLLVGALALLLVGGPSRVVGAASGSSLAVGGGAVSGHLTSKSFSGSRAGSVRLVYSFSTASARFSYRLSKRVGKRWQLVRAANKAGSFAGTHTISVRALFAPKPVRVGSYRLLISGDHGSKLLGFSVVEGGLAVIGRVAGVGQVSQGGGHTCALLSGGAVKCWGWNLWGQLGNDQTTSSVAPVKVAGLTGARQISAGFARNCVVLADRGVACWGGTLNPDQSGNFIADTQPTRVPGVSDVIQVSAGIGYHNCAVQTQGTIECWGMNYDGSLGNGSLAPSLTPVQVNGIGAAVQVSAGYQHTCAVLSGGTIECWGKNTQGELGNGTTVTSPTAVRVTGVSDARQVSAGNQNTCAVLSSGAVECWGSNQFGELGNGSSKSSLVPVRVKGIGNAREVSVGGDHACALLSGGTLKCWGNNLFNQLGGVNKLQSSVPVIVGGITKAKGISSGSAGYQGGSGTCALLSGGKVSCWGNNWYGQRG